MLHTVKKVCPRKQAEIRIASSLENVCYRLRFAPKSGKGSSLRLDLNFWDITSLKQNPCPGSTSLYIFLKVIINACESGTLRHQEWPVEIKAYLE